jgi:hypothetical protein
LEKEEAWQEKLIPAAPEMVAMFEMVGSASA